MLKGGQKRQVKYINVAKRFTNLMLDNCKTLSTDTGTFTNYVTRKTHLTDLTVLALSTPQKSRIVLTLKR